MSAQRRIKTVDNFYLTKVIGGGQYGTVYLCKIRKQERIESETKLRMRGSRPVACKMMNQNKIKSRIKKYLIQEIEIMMKIKHENILRFLEAKKTANNIYLFFEFCNGGDLRRFLEARGGQLDEKLTRVITKQIAAGLQHLNENHSMHRDLKLDNILLNFPNFVTDEPQICPESYLRDFDVEKDTVEVVIGDLGFARSIAPTDMATSYCGTPLNMAPEIMMGELYDNKVDIWSFGTMMYELLVGFAPFTGTDPHDLADNVIKGNYGIPKSVKLSLQCLDMLHKCLQFETKKRIDHEGLLKHPFLLDEDNDESAKISLSCSQGPDQDSFFRAPKNVYDLNEKNAVIFNAKDSCLFNHTYQKALRKFQEKQENGEIIVQEPEVLEEVKEEEEKDNLCGADSEDDFEDYKSILEESSQHKSDKKVELPIESIEMNANEQVKVMKSEHVKKHEVAEEILEENKEKSNVLNLVDKLNEDPVEEEHIKTLIVNQQDQNEDFQIHNEVKAEEKEEEFDEGQIVEDEEECVPLDFTVIDFNKELLRAKKLKPIVEEDEDIESSIAKSVANAKSKSEEKQEIENAEGKKVEDEDTGFDFEIVHYHDITAIDHKYLIGESVV